MKMKNLGSMILFFLMALPLMAELKVSVDKTQITRGETVRFTVSVTGEGKVSVPPFDELCGYSIEGRMQSTKDIFSNGKRSQELSLIYEIMPQKSCVIESFPVTINGETQTTEPINITVSKVAITTNAPFTVELQTEKRSVYVGEPFEMKVELKARQGIDVLAESISLPESKNIWVKSEQKGKPLLQEGYSKRNNTYALAAQQSGILTLGPLRWDVKVRNQSRDNWGMWLATAKTHSVFSNEIELEVKELPAGVSLVGELEIEASVDKTEVNAGEAVNVDIRVKGPANIEDLPAFEIHVDGAQAFKEEPKKTHYLRDGKYFGDFSQKLALVAERDFTVPSFEIRYMDVTTDTLKTIKTQPIEIKVLNSAPVVKEELKISRPQEKPEENVQSTEGSALNLMQGAFLLIGGIVLGLIFSMIPWKRVFTKDKRKHAVSVKESKEVLQLLMGHMHTDPEIEALVQRLSENLYEGKVHEIDKKRLKEIVKKLQG
jgi:hypothetical protein